MSRQHTANELRDWGETELIEYILELESRLLKGC